MSTSMRGLLCEGGMIRYTYGYHWIRLIESFQMSTCMRGLLCKAVMIYMGTIGFISLRAFK